MPKYVVALDQGTTSSRAMLVDANGCVVDAVQNPFPQVYPQPGWVEHDPRDILSSQLGALTELLVAHNLGAKDIDSIGITNQRETTVVWNRETGEPVMNAIVWQCRRTAPIIDELTADPQTARIIADKTGLVPDAYFSASKIKWILDHVEGAREDAEAGKLAFGTVDTWLIWTLTQGKVHATDVTNASRTMLYNIHELRWDPWLLDLFDIPESLLPEVLPSSGEFGRTASAGIVPNVPICGVAGDQQAALFGQCCFQPGQAKNTYGTGCFLLMHTGGEACRSTNNLITTIAASGPGAGPEYALEGSVFMAGALMQWLRDDMGIIDDVAETSAIARSVNSTDGVYVVPAFTGLGRRCARRHLRAHARNRPGSHRARRAGIAGLPGARPRGGHGGRRGGALERAQRGRRRVRERFSHAVPKRYLAHAAAPPAECRDDRARRRVPRRARHRVLEGRGSPVCPALFGRRVRAGHGGRAPREAAGRLGSRREAHDVGRPVILSGAPKERSCDAKPVL